MVRPLWRKDTSNIAHPWQRQQIEVKRLHSFPRSERRDSENMRLLAHNMLQCPRTQGYPLKLKVEECNDVEMDYSEAFIKRMIPRLNWQVFLEAAQQLPDADTLAALPEEPPGDEANEDVLRAIHRALMEWRIVEGVMECEGARYRITKGVPNLVMTEVRQDGMDVDGNGKADAEGSS